MEYVVVPLFLSSCRNSSPFPSAGVLSPNFSRLEEIWIWCPLFSIRLNLCGSISDLAREGLARGLCARLAVRTDFYQQPICFFQREIASSEDPTRASAEVSLARRHRWIALTWRSFLAQIIGHSR